MSTATAFGFADGAGALAGTRCATDGTLVRGPADGSPWRGASDERLYRAVTLRNGLRGMLVSDPRADKAAAAVAVAVGHMSDPRALPGLAHVVEHLLFLGSKRYPGEDEYKSYLKDSGGASNASTGPEATAYHFTVRHEHLAGALDRLASYFEEGGPLFAPSAVGRELRAVDAEDAKNRQDDGRRLLQVRKDVAARAHAYSKFGTGNLQTLAVPGGGTDAVRDAMVAHYTAHYGARVTTLAVLGREPLDELEAWVTGRGGAGTGFGAMPPGPHAVHVDASQEHPFPASALGRAVFVPPVRDLRAVSLTWPMPDAPPPDYDHVHRVVSHLLGHEGAGSLLAALKARGWAQALSAGGSAHRHFATFGVEVGLTPEGLARLDDVVGLVHAHVALLRALPASAWEAHWGEAAQVAANSLRFRAQASPVTAVTTIAAALQHYPSADALAAPSLFREWDAAGVAGVLALLTPRNALAVVSAKEMPASWGASGGPGHGAPVWADHTERYYGVAYRVAAFTPAQLASWGAHAAAAAAAAREVGAAAVALPYAVEALAAANGWELAMVAPLPPGVRIPSLPADLAAPLPNPYIPTQFALAPAEGGAAGTPAAGGAAAEEAAAELAALRVAVEEGAVGEADVDVVVAAPGSGGEAGLGQPAPAVPVAAAPTPGTPLRPHPLDFPLDAHLRPVSWGALRAPEQPPAPPGLAAAPPPTVVRVFPEPEPLALPPLPPGVRAWHKQGTTFGLPKTHVYALLRLPRGLAQGHGARHRVLASLWTSLLHDGLGAVSYPAEIAGLSYGASSHSDLGAVGLSVAGFSHRLPELLRVTAGALAGTEAAVGGSAAFDAVFARCHDALTRGLAGAAKAQPYVRARSLAAEYTASAYVSSEACLAAADGVNADDLRAYLTAVRQGLRGDGDGDGDGGGGGGGGGSGGDSRDPAALQAFVYGNTSRQGSADVARELAGLLLPPPPPPSPAAGPPTSSVASATTGPPTPRVLLLPPGTTHVVSRRHPNPDEANAAVHVTWQLGATTPATWAAASLLATLASQPIFDQLRTKEQLGYLVFSGADTQGGGAIAAFTITVQSSTASVAHLTSRVDAVVASFRAALAGMTPESIRAKAALLAARMTEADKTPGAEASRLWGPLAAGTHDFHGDEEVAAVLTGGSLTEPGTLLALYDACVMPGGRYTRALVARVYAGKETGGGEGGGGEAAAGVLHGGGPAAFEPHAAELTASAEEFKAGGVSVSAASAGSAAASGVWMPTAVELARMARGGAGVLGA